MTKSSAWKLLPIVVVTNMLVIAALNHFYGPVWTLIIFVVQVWANALYCGGDDD